MFARESEEEKWSHTSHSDVYLSKVSLSRASISSILMVSFIIETQRDNGGVAVDFQ